MATIPPVEVKAMFDGTDLRTGTDAAADDMARLADSVDAAATDMRASLSSIDDGVSSTLGTGGTFSSGVDDVDAEGGRLAGVGSEVGAEFAANLQEGVASGDLKGSLIDTFSGLGAAAGATGQLGLAAAGVGVLLGATLVKGLTQAAEEKRAEAIAAVASILDGMEIKARTTARQIQKELIGAFDLQTVAEALGEDGDLNDGLNKIKSTSEAIGVPWRQLLDVLQGDITPKNEYILELLEIQSQELDYQVKTAGGIVDVKTDEARIAEELLGYSEETTATQEKSKEVAEALRADLRYEADKRKDSADSAKVQADETERMSKAYADTVTYAQELYELSKDIGENIASGVTALADALNGNR